MHFIVTGTENAIRYTGVPMGSYIEVPPPYWSFTVISN